MKSAALLTILLLPFALEPSGCAHQIEADPDDDSASSGSSGQTTGSSSSGAGAAGSGSSTGASVGSGGNGGAGGGTCGDGMIDPGETCDPSGSCPTDCSDSNACTVDTLQGAAITCDVVCSNAPITACVADGCCAPACAPGTDPDCAACGNGMVDIGEQCDDGDLDNTDACLVNCADAACGDGFVQAGVEQCDDGNVVGGDGCSAACTSSNGTYGPVHTFQGLSSSFYITQFGCSNSGGDAAGDALYFCQHFYSAACIAEPGYVVGSSSTNPMMHSGTNCYSPDTTGVDIPGTACVGGPCKIGDYGGPLGGLSNIICSCP
jgi:cysteine-rich repeat protein